MVLDTGTAIALLIALISSNSVMWYMLIQYAKLQRKYYSLSLKEDNNG